MSETNYTYLPAADDEEYIKVADNTDSGEFMEFPKETDGTVLLTTIQSHFPNAIGIKHKGPSGAFRSLRAVDNKFDPPRSGWGDNIYYVTSAEPEKRKMDEGNRGANKLFKASVYNPLLQDMAVLGLPWRVTDDELKTYFENKCGPVAYCEVKKDRETGKSRGFGFVRFKDEESAEIAHKSDHFIDGRNLEVKMKKDTQMKIFVGRLPDGTTTEELQEYFSEFGEVKDTYVPNPFRGFGFVTFASSEVGKHVLQESHFFKGARLNVDKGEESKTFNKNRTERPNERSSDRDRESRSSNYSSRGGDRFNPNKVEQVGAADPSAELKNMLFQFLKQN